MRVKEVENKIYWMDEKGKPYDALDYLFLPEKQKEKLRLIEDRYVSSRIFYYCPQCDTWHTALNYSDARKIIQLSPDCIKMKSLSVLVGFDYNFINNIDKKNSIIDLVKTRFIYYLERYLLSNENSFLFTLMDIVKNAYEFFEYKEFNDLLVYLNQFEDIRR
ncbi:MAG: hypothetical protein QXS74_06390 [Nitrososphaeria archaeon]